MKIVVKLRDAESAAAVGHSFRSYFVLNSNFPLMFYFNAQLFCGALLYHTVCSEANVICNIFMIFYLLSLSVAAFPCPN
jgi:hypothetical protein